MPRVTGKPIVISRDKICAQWRGKTGPRFGQAIEISGRAIIEIAADEHDIGLQAGKHANDAPNKSAVPHVPQVSIAYQSSHASAPGFRQVGQLDTNLVDASVGCICHPIKTRQDCRSKECPSNQLRGKMNPKKPGRKVKNPTGYGSREKETGESKPDSGKRVEQAHDQVGIAKGQKRRADETHRKQSHEKAQLRW